MLPKLAVIVTDQIFRTFTPGRSLSQLLRHPGIAGMCGHGTVHDATTGMFHDHEDEKRPKHDVVDLGEITGPDLWGVVVQKCRPGLTRRTGSVLAIHILLDRTLADLDAQFEEFAPNAFRTPSLVIRCHLPNKCNGLYRDSR